MDYTETSNWFEYNHTTMSGGTIKSKNNTFLKYYPFVSHGRIKSRPQNQSSKSIYELDNVKENNSFYYPVIIPGNVMGKFNNALVLLHGLNEKSWLKYFAWAEYLSVNTGKPVIMFPISYHMNRAPKNWSNPKMVIKDVSRRKLTYVHTELTSFANIAISERLTSNPGRFFISGHQSATDIISLIDRIKTGNHPLFNKDSHVDFFAYSIGALLAQVLFIANTKNLFRESKYFFFCGGSVFESMKGISKYIMDSKAYDTINSYYLNSIDRGFNKRDKLYHIISRTKLGKAFKILLSFNNLNGASENVFKKYHDNFMAIVLEKDLIIPTAGVIKTLEKSRLDIMNFPYNYTHENPFPIFKGEKSKIVDKAFNQVFKEASAFLR